MNGQNNQAERPDKSLFFAMMGAFFICFALAPAYWAVHNFGEYQLAQKLISDWKQKPESIPKDAYAGNPIEFQESQSKRYLLEKLGSAAGSFVLLGIALLFFAKAFKNRNRKSFYREIDWRVISPPTARVEVKYTNFQNFLLVGLSGFFALTAVFIFYQTFTSRFSTTREITVKGAFCLLIFGIVFVLIFLAMRARRNAVKLFDASGVTRGDGRHFPWTAFCGVVTQTARNRFGQNYTWRKELAFSGGETAWIIPPRVKNADEVFGYLAQLPPATLKN